MQIRASSSNSVFEMKKDVTITEVGCLLAGSVYADKAFLRQAVVKCCMSFDNGRTAVEDHDRE